MTDYNDLVRLGAQYAAAGTPSPDDGQECGVAYDHDLALIAEADGYASYECNLCGAEIETQPDERDDR